MLRKRPCAAVHWYEGASLGVVRSTSDGRSAIVLPSNDVPLRRPGRMVMIVYSPFGAVLASRLEPGLGPLFQCVARSVGLVGVVLLGL